MCNWRIISVSAFYIPRFYASSGLLDLLDVNVIHGTDVRTSSFEISPIPLLLVGLSDRYCPSLAAIVHPRPARSSCDSSLVNFSYSHSGLDTVLHFPCATWFFQVLNNNSRCRGFLIVVCIQVLYRIRRIWVDLSYPFLECLPFSGRILGFSFLWPC